MSSFGHALRLDGTLKDASEMTWTFDEDEAIPFPSDAVSGGGTLLSSPAEPIAGVRRTTRISGLPRRYRNELDETSKVSVHVRAINKRKAPPDDDLDNCQRVACKLKTGLDQDASADGTITEVATEPADDDYRPFKEMADADHQAAVYRPREERTADVRLIFRRDKGYIHPISGKILDGHWCMVCRDGGSVNKPVSSFFTGSISTLRTHIARHHVQLYRKRCKSLGIEPNPRALYRVPSEASTDNLTQTRLEGVIIREPKIPAFSNPGLLDHIIELIICEDEAFRLIERGSFRKLLKFCRPSLSERDIPHRHTLRAEILRRAHIAEGMVRENMEKIVSKISFTFDAWTSAPGDPYLSLTAHYIDAPTDCPDAWELRSEQLIFQEIQGRHTGKNMADLLGHALDRYGLRSKVGWFTSDGAAVNRTTLRVLQNSASVEPGWTAQQHDMLCMEHSLHLAAKHFVQAIAPHFSGATSGVDLEGDAASDNDDDGGDDDNSAEEDESVNNGDSLGKAIALVKQVRKSPQARAFFRGTCSQVGITPRELLLWIRTRWGSLYKFLERFLYLKSAIIQFILLADASDTVPNLPNHRSYSDFHLSRRDWERLESIRDALREPSNVQQTFSSERAPTVWRIIPSFEFLIKRWDTMANETQHHGLKQALDEGVKSLHKWHSRVDGTSSPAYFICLVLDPNIKDIYFQHRWSREQYAAGMKQLEGVFDQYYTTFTQVTTTNPEDVAPVCPSILEPLYHYGGSYLHNSVQAFQQQVNAAGSPRDELQQYLKSGVETTANIPGWWGSSTKYPTLKRMARDYLAIQGSATPSERAFSSGGITGCSRRNKLKPNIFEGLQLLKSAYRNGHISATTQAGCHTENSITFIDSSSEGEDEVD